MADIVMVMPTDGILTKYRESQTPPMSILAASSLADSAGYKIRIIDQRVERDWKSQLLSALAARPLFVGVTSMTGSQIGFGLEISRIAKENGTPVVWGGVHPSLLPEQTLANPYVDMVVQGEGERTVLELADALSRNGPLDGIPGLWYKKDGRIHGPPSPRQFSDLNELPDLPYHLIDTKKYFDIFFGQRFVSVMTSRGCPHDCAFCYNTIFNSRKWRALTPDRALERIQRASEAFNSKSIWIRDDNFFVDVERSKTIMRGLEKMGVAWGTSGARGDTMGAMDDDCLKLVERSGCKFLMMGYESGSDRILNLMHKGVTTADITAINRKLSKLDVAQRASFIIGYPTETYEETAATVKFTFKLLDENPHLIIAGLLIASPFPGTELFEVAKKYGFRPPESLEQWSDFKSETGRIPWADDDRKKMLQMLLLTSYFYNRRVEKNAKNPMMKLLGKMYYPVAMYRLRNLSTGFAIEPYIAKMFGF